MKSLDAKPLLIVNQSLGLNQIYYTSMSHTVQIDWLGNSMRLVVNYMATYGIMRHVT